jgi:hypothetical protein
MTTWGTVLAVVSVASLLILFVSEMMKGRGEAERERRAFEDARKNHDGAHFADVISGKIDCPFCLPNHKLTPR